MKIDFPQLAKTLDTMIRHGKANLARKEMRKLAKVKVPRNEAIRFASLARRANLPALGIRILNPIVRPSPKSPVIATDAEKAEYAVCLNNYGASEEALGILKTIDSKSHPEVLLYHAFALFSRWEYAESIPLLTRYVRASGLTEYARLVGKINLAAASVAAHKYTQSTVLLRELLYETSLARYELIHGNALELAAQNFVVQGKWADADRCLAKASEELKEAETLDEFFVRKWMAISHVLRSNGAPASLTELKKIRDEAVTNSNWETLRQADLFEAKSRRDEKLALKVFFGTPYDSFRKQLQADLALKVPDEIVWYPGGHKTGKVYDLLMGEKTKSGGRLKAGQILHRLLATLTADFYRPMRVASVHFHLYPDEYFNPVSSPPRVHEAVKRLRQWLEANEILLSIEELDGFYRLVATGPVGIKIRHSPESDAKKTAGGKFAVHLQKLQRRWPKASFTINDASKELDISPRSTLRVLEAGMKESGLQRVGRGYATRYTFAA